MTDVEATRPGLVTVVAVLTVIPGILSLFVGFLWLFLPPDSSLNGTAWRLFGVVYLIVGIAELAVARGLLRGDARARVIFTLVMVVNLALGVLGATSSDTARGLSFVDLVLVIIAIAVLYTRKANAFFGRGPA